MGEIKGDARNLDSGSDRYLAGLVDICTERQALDQNLQALDTCRLPDIKTLGFRV